MKKIIHKIIKEINYNIFTSFTLLSKSCSVCVCVWSALLCYRWCRLVTYRPVSQVQELTLLFFMFVSFSILGIRQASISWASADQALPKLYFKKNHCNYCWKTNIFITLGEEKYINIGQYYYSSYHYYLYCSINYFISQIWNVVLNVFSILYNIGNIKYYCQYELFPIILFYLSEKFTLGVKEWIKSRHEITHSEM